MIGVKRGTVRLAAYDSSRKDEFETEKRLLLETFGDMIIAIEHFGSTAIPGAWAKPIIDINVAIKSLDDAPKFIKKLQKLDYEYMPNRWFDDRYFFPKGPDECRTHHLNLVEKTSETGWVYPLIFRDYLISHPQELKNYCRLKKSWQQSSVKTGLHIPEQKVHLYEIF